MKLEDPRCTSLGIYENKLFIDDISVEIFVRAITFIRKRGTPTFPRTGTIYSLLMR